MAAAAGFWAHAHGPLVTLVFGSSAAQHAALARVESFYESATHAGTYLSWDEARRARLCQGYEAYNLPMDSVREWLTAMRAAIGTEEDPETDVPWWKAHCSPEEQALLAYLSEQGALTPEGGTGAHSYLISALVKRADEALEHERLHALYYLSPSYRALLNELWASLPKAIASAIQFDLQMRGYREDVWRDELGAYLGVRGPHTRRKDPCQEFGNKSASACAEVRRTLLERIPTCWKEDVGLEEATLQLPPSYIDQARQALGPPRPPSAPARRGRPGRR
ncbi:enhancer of mRNA decapping [Malassezia nana]|uniref:Enhancer of mRNA decapping n=1 Tax=Malassezia nana TaxID=180528 RepID=A0AAF0EMQ1_9BASI|nr:enhancer of mRNA decapping [Malassezia nana]